MEIALVGGLKITIGDILISTERAEENSICSSNRSVTVHKIKKDADNDILIGLKSPVRVEGWSDLDGLVGQNQGLWLYAVIVQENFLLCDGRVVIITPIAFRDKSLYKKKGRLLHCDRKLDVCVVELEENVGAGGGDGLGKSGHCVIISPKDIERTNPNSTVTWRS